MTITMFDAVTISNIPKDANYVAGYVNGHWPTYKTLVALYPGKTVLSIAVTKSADAECLDIEPGDAVNADAPGWVQRQLTRGVVRPVLYTSVSNMDALIATLTAAGIKRDQVRLWSAHYGAGEHICGPQTCRKTKQNCDGTQWTSTAQGKSLDQSVLLDNFFQIKIDPEVTVCKGEPIDMQVTPHLVDVPKLDKDGNGWVTLGVPVEKVVSMVKWGPAPQRDGGYENPGWPDFDLKLNNTGGQAEISIESDVPFGHVSFTVWVAE